MGKKSKRRRNASKPAESSGEKPAKVQIPSSPNDDQEETRSKINQQTAKSSKPNGDESTGETSDNPPAGKKQRKQEDDGNDEQQPPASNNPFKEKIDQFISTLTESEQHSFFSVHVSPERRAEVWMQQADAGEALVNQYAWAVPNDACMAILKHFGPIVEIGCGANAYWCRQMQRCGIDVIGFDAAPAQGGRIVDHNSNGKPKAKKSKKQNKSVAEKQEFEVQEGGPEVLSEHSGRTLFLCYPDENDEPPDPKSEEEPVPLGVACLQNYTGNYVVHVGEVYGDTLSFDQAPWGRSSSPEFQQQLAAEFHCILKVPLKSWVHVRDSITVWKRSEMCTIAFATEGDDDDDEQEDEEDEMKYRHIPAEEQLMGFAVPSLSHLLPPTAVAPAVGKVEPSDVPPEERPPKPVPAKKKHGAVETPSETTNSSSPGADDTPKPPIKTQDSGEDKPKPHTKGPADDKKAKPQTKKRDRADDKAKEKTKNSGAGDGKNRSGAGDDARLNKKQKKKKSRLGPKETSAHEDGDDDVKNTYECPW